MANKTPPLVIPVVIDSTGVNKGISDINSRLRTGVRGGGAGGGSTPGVGGGSFGGGGGAAEAILGGAVAGGVAARTGGGGASNSAVKVQGRTTLFGKATPSFKRDEAFTRGPYGRAAGAFYDIKNATSAYAAWEKSNAPGVMNTYETSPGVFGTPTSPYEIKREFHDQRKRRGKMFSAVASSQRRGAFGRALRNLDAASSGISLGAVAGGAIGLGMVSALRGGGRGDVGELAGLVGSRDYGYLRGMQNRAPSGAPLSVMNSMKLGMAKRAGMGVTTQFENQSNAFNRAVQISGEVVGGVYEGLAQSTTDLLVVIAQNVFGMNKDAGNRQFWEAIQRRATN
jgi:hypothetical protein